MKATLLALALSVPVAASAAERGYSVTDFDRIRVDGPYRVTLATGRSPGARAIGSASAIDALQVEMQGRTLIVRRNSQSWGGTPGASDGPVELRVTGFAVRAAGVNGAGSLLVDRLKGQSVEVALSGSGTLDVGAVEADRLNAGIAGSGRMRLAGRAAGAQLTVRGTGLIDAERLTVKDLKVAADGPAEIRVAATGTASVMSNGSGAIAVSGTAACTVKATGSGAVACGRGPSR